MLSEEREPQRLIFKIFISDLSMCPGFSVVIALTELNKVNDFRIYIHSLIDVVFGVAVVVSLAP